MSKNKKKLLLVKKILKNTKKGETKENQERNT